MQHQSNGAGFINMNFENKTENVLEAGRKAVEFMFSVPADEQARILVAFVQGAQLLSRSSGEIGYYDALVTNFMASLRVV